MLMRFVLLITSVFVLASCGGSSDDPNIRTAPNKAVAGQLCGKVQRADPNINDQQDITYVLADGTPLLVCVR